MLVPINGLHGVISQKTELLNCRYILLYLLCILPAACKKFYFTRLVWDVLHHDKVVLAGLCVGNVFQAAFVQTRSRFSQRDSYWVSFDRHTFRLPAGFQGFPQFIQGNIPITGLPIRIATYLGCVWLETEYGLVNWFIDHLELHFTVHWHTQTSALSLVQSPLAVSWQQI
jgi:hypothetical protein